MKSLMRKRFGLAAVLTLLSSPALAQSYYDGGSRYEAPYHHSWYHERQEYIWRTHERQEAWWHASHDRGFYNNGFRHGGVDYQDSYDAPPPWDY